MPIAAWRPENFRALLSAAPLKYPKHGAVPGQLALFLRPFERGPIEVRVCAKFARTRSSHGERGLKHNHVCRAGGGEDGNL